MIDKMAETYFDLMLPLNEQFSATSLFSSSSSEDDDKSSQQDYHMVSDDHWKKFELDFPELANIDDIFSELDSNNTFSNWLEDVDSKDCLFLNHDCMWAGHCSSKEHAEEPRSGLVCIVPKPPVIKKEMCPPPSTTKPAGTGQQSLLKPSVKAANTTVNTFIPSNTTNIIQHTPQTPPESDDEENKAHTSNLLKILNDAINECDLDDDSDLCEYFEDKEGSEVKEEPIDIKEEPVDVKLEPEDPESEQDEISYQQYRIRTQLAAENDHSYHKDKNAVMRHNNYGLDTPSDSEEEEEIDVVSVSDKLCSNASRIALSLPTNPSTRDRQQLQRRVATAISRKRINNGIKTILPVRNAETPSTSSSTSSSTRSRGTKRGRGTRTNAGYKRRRTNMDGEREPSDKRHLHNDMERQRRVDLRIAFENLKAVVPEVSGTKKIAKVNILLQAAQYCYYLTGASINYTKQMDELRRKQVWLRSRVSQLRRNLAARR